MTSKQQLMMAGAGLGLIVWLLVGSGLDLRSRGEQRRLRIFALRGRVESSRKALAATHHLEEEADALRSEINQWERKLPAGPAEVWLPPRVQDHFSRYGFAKPVIRLDFTQPDPELTHYRHLYWRVSVPLEDEREDLRHLLGAVGELEEAVRTVKVIDLAVQPDLLHPPHRQAVMTLAALARK